MAAGRSSDETSAPDGNNKHMSKSASSWPKLFTLEPIYMKDYTYIKKFYDTYINMLKHAHIYTDI
jgi:hypothetical protein